MELRGIFEELMNDGVVSSFDDFENKVKEWVLDSDRIVTHKIIDGSVILIINPETNGLGTISLGAKKVFELRYKILRFFTIGGKWIVSVDKENLTSEELISELI